MKRFAIAALAALTMVGPIATSTAYADPPAQARRDNDRNDRNDNSRNDNRRDNDRRGNNQSRWNDREHNGYTMNGRWYYGPPPAQYANRAQLGYHQWRRGERLPSYYSQRYRQVDYRREHLRAPPRGYHYVRDDRGDTLMVAVATGVIASIILASR